MDSERACSIAIFGASGDLAQRKLIPALFNLKRKGRLPERLQIAGYGGTALGDDQFRQHLLEGVRRFAGFAFTDEEWSSFARVLSYHRGSYDDPSELGRFGERLAALEGAEAGRLYYMAVPPSVVPRIVEALGSAGLLHEDRGWRRVVVEKPFATDLASARELNRQLHNVLREAQIYRIDHYLGKETVQNILVMRFANAIFEPLWNRNYIDHVQLTVAETVGVEHRGGYYDGIGVLRDMFQNHLLQLMTLVALEPPSSITADGLRNEKVKVLSAIQPVQGRAAVAENAVPGQYRGYQNEPRVRPGSTTPTFGALRLFISNWRWHGVPFYLRSGKRLADKMTEILIRFKEPPLAMFHMPADLKAPPNVLALHLQPDEGLHLRFEAKVPDTVAETRSVDMEFHYAETFGRTAIPEAYERLLLDAVQGDASLFTRDDEAEAAWKLIDPIAQEWEAAGTSGAEAGAPPTLYEPGSWGPPEAEALLARDGRSWIHDEHRPGPATCDAAAEGQEREPGG